MTGTSRKRVISLLLALAVLVSGFTVFQSLSVRASAEENMITEEPEVSGTAKMGALSAPQNLRVENGFVVWDEVEGAYGYTLKAFADGTTKTSKYYENRVEFNRFCYEKELGFGEYDLTVCSFNESDVSGEWSGSISIAYRPTLEKPQMRLSDDGESILWDNAINATRYNARVFNAEQETPVIIINRGFMPFRFEYDLKRTGNFSIVFQAMDDDYNISDWSDPIVVSYTAPGEILPPQNVRFDESGNNILWDAVDGARFYNACFYNIYDDGSEHGIGNYYAPNNEYYNWKVHACPFSNGEYKIYISVTGESSSAGGGGPLTVTFKQTKDGSISLPENIRLDEGHLRWDDIEDAAAYWLRIYKNGELVEGEDSHYIIADKNNGVEINNRLPEGEYSAELFVVDKNYNFNSKTYALHLDTPHNSAVWTPKVFYKFETLLWDFDQIRYNHTSYFWARIDQNGETICLDKLWRATYSGIIDLPDGEYEVQVCAYDYVEGIGPWSEPLKITKYNGSLFDKENEVTTEITPPPEAENIPASDRITSITINSAFNMAHQNGNNVELDIKKLVAKASEIYDEAGLKRLEEALGHKIKKNQKYNLLDIALLYDGKDFSNEYKGLVKVIIPIPSGHRDKTFVCYRLTTLNGKTTNEIIPGEQTEDSYIIYLEHFSEYALVGTAAEEKHTLEKHNAVPATCTTTGNSVYWTCSGCGSIFSDENGTVEINEIPIIAATGHTWNSGEITTPATIEAEGVKTYTCTVCGDTKTESIPKLSGSDPDTPSHTHTYSSEWTSDKTYHWHAATCEHTTEVSDKAAHNWDGGVITRQPTTSREGIRTYTCTVCGRTKTESIAKLNGGSSGSGSSGGSSRPSRPDNPGTTVPGTVTEEMRGGENSPGAKVITPLDDLIKAVCTSSEQQLIKNGSDCKIILSVKDVDEDLFKRFLGGSEYKVVFLLDIDLLKEIDGLETAVTETGSEVTVEIEIPEVFRSAGREYVIIRYHNGERTVLEDIDNSDDFVTFKSDRFSMYGLAYIDESSNSGTSDTSGSSSSDLEDNNSSDSGNSSTSEDNTSSDSSGKSDSDGTASSNSDLSSETGSSGNISTPSDSENPSTGIAISIIPCTAALVALTAALKRRNK